MPLLLGANDWWWAVDNIAVTSSAGPTPVLITRQPVGGLYTAGQPVTISVTTTGSEPISYQSQKGGVNIAGATASTYVINSIQAADAGSYTVLVQNTDTEAGKIGSAVHIPSGADYISLGAPVDSNFRTTTDFSIAFWARVNAFNGDPSLIGNKDWDSDGNQGYVIFTDSNRRVDWNLAGGPGVRKDGDQAPNVLTNDAWAHVVVTFDRDGQAVTYVNGVRGTGTSIAADKNNLDAPEGFATNIGQDGAGDVN